MAKTILNRLSDRRVRTAPPGKHPDGGGLYLRVSKGANGVTNRYWFFRYADRGDGRDRELGLGALHTIGLAEARTAARECREMLLRGQDPIAARRAQHAATAVGEAKAMTFDECRDAFIAAHQPSWSNLKHAKQWETTLATYVTPVFGHLPVAAVDTGLVLKVLEPLWATKSETMARVRGRIESILAWAKVRGYRVGENPALWRGHLDHLLPAKTKMRKGKATHHPALPYQRIGEFMANLRSCAGMAARELEFTILTAARTEEVLGARWTEIDLATQTWTVPAERMKGRVEHRVPLSEPALAILRAMQVVGGASAAGYVFPGRKPGRPVGDIALRDQVRRMNADRQAAGLPIYTDPQQGNREVTPHGMRSAFRDWAAERTNFPRELAEKALAHTIGDETERAYQRGELLEKRRSMMAAWATYCGKPAVTGDTVVPLRREIPA